MKFVFLNILFFISSFCHAQNIITNPSFESTSGPVSCSMANFSQVSNWKDLGSADHYSITCPVFPGSCSLPVNWAGVLYPKDGDKVSAIGMSPDFNVGCEYIYQELSQPLKKDYIYCMEYYVTRADDCEWAVRDIDAWFSSSLPLIDSSTFKLIADPQIRNYTGIITDTIDWVLVSDTFIAKGSEEYVTIGNFTMGANVNYSHPGTSNPNPLSNRVYYFIDKVSLYVCDSIVKPEPPNPPNNSEYFIPNVFTPNADNVNDTFKIELGEATTIDFKLYNRWGNLIYETNQETILWDGRTTSGEPCSEGVYFYTLKYVDVNGESQSKNGYVSLFR